jgi:hypothetical protein
MPQPASGRLFAGSENYDEKAMRRLSGQSQNQAPTTLLDNAYQKEKAGLIISETQDPNTTSYVDNSSDFTNPENPSQGGGLSTNSSVSRGQFQNGTPENRYSPYITPQQTIYQNQNQQSLVGRGHSLDHNINIYTQPTTGGPPSPGRQFAVAIQPAQHAQFLLQQQQQQQYAANMYAAPQQQYYIPPQFQQYNQQLQQHQPQQQYPLPQNYQQSVPVQQAYSQQPYIQSVGTVCIFVLYQPRYVLDLIYINLHL